MRYKFRNNADSGLWLSFLLPLCLLRFSIKSNFGEEKVIFAIIAWLSISQIIKRAVYNEKRFDFQPHYVFHAVLSIPVSFGLAWFISHDFVKIYLICVGSMLSYNCLISQLLAKCPHSFTLGEVQIIAQGIILFVLSSLNSLVQSGFHPDRTKYHEAMDLLMLLLLGLLLLVCSLNFVPSLRKGMLFHCSCFTFTILMIFIWSYCHQQNFILWLFEYCTYNSKRVYLLIFWLISTLASVFVVIWVNQRSFSKASTVDRKYFHILINTVYITGVIYDGKFLCFASGVVLGIFLVLEIYRILAVPIIGTAIEQAFQIFLDEKDSGPLILTHIYLLVGCSCPLWLSSSYIYKSDYHICLLSGIISVGFGDTFAAIGGTLYGKHKWKGSKKTFEGTVCGIFAQLLCSFFFVHIGHHFSLLNTLLVILSVLFTSILEAKTDQIDNLVLPLFMFSFLTWID